MEPNYDAPAMNSFTKVYLLLFAMYVYISSGLEGRNIHIVAFF